MEIIDWWPRLDAETRRWLIEHNGEAVPREVLNRIVAVTGSAHASEPWVGEPSAEGFSLSDGAVDWIETTANEESD